MRIYTVFAVWGAASMHIYAVLVVWGAESMRIRSVLAVWGAASTWFPLSEEQNLCIFTVFRITYYRVCKFDCCDRCD